MSDVSDCKCGGGCGDNFRRETSPGIKYPYYDAGVMVLGPECFADEEAGVVCWRGENYYRNHLRKTLTFSYPDPRDLFGDIIRLIKLRG